MLSPASGEAGRTKPSFLIANNISAICNNEILKG